MRIRYLQGVGTNFFIQKKDVIFKITFKIEKIPSRNIIKIIAHLRKERYYDKLTLFNWLVSLQHK